MGLLDGLVGGAVGAGLAVAAEKFIDNHGGVQGIVSQMQSKGFGDTVKSWVSTGPNQPISPSQVAQAFDVNHLASMATQLGVSQDQLHQALAQFLPQAVDHLTPGGAVPPKP
ncbi:MAG: YidB family protein [Terricaulis silvestris]